MVWSYVTLVSPLRSAENIFLEVLLTQFNVYRHNEGNRLVVRFNDNTPTIWSREAKYLIPKILPDFKQKSEQMQEDLDAFFFRRDNRSKYTYLEDDFPFRYASGGALPVIRYGQKEYYCLTYHETFPVGWNIANGGCRNVNELLNPVNALERELQVELIILDLNKKKRYVFQVDDMGKALYHPECAIANRFWANKLKLPQFEDEFEELRMPLKWLKGPDRLEIVYRGEPARIIADCYLNINAQDYGIEIDRVAKLNLDEGAILCHGEITRNDLFNRPIGLFEVHQLNRAIKNRAHEFTPDYLFYDAQRIDGKRFEYIMTEGFIPAVKPLRPPEQMAEYESIKFKYDLCPATRKIIRRYSILQSGRAITPRKYDVFISFAQEDEDIAREIYDFLRAKRIKTFFSKESYNADYQTEIDDALSSANCLIAVAAKVENLKRNWPKFEYESFHLDILNKRKPENAGIVPFISGFEPVDLPRALAGYLAVEFDSTDLRAELDEMYQIVRRCLKREEPAI